jgi:GNAT superfamily N-acetyltransferase
MASSSQYSLVTPATYSNFFEEVTNAMGRTYPKFLNQDFLASQSWHQLFEVYSDFQFALVENATQRLVAQGSCLPLSWKHPLEELPDEGCGWAFMKGLEDRERGIQPNLLGAVSISVIPEYQGKGLSKYILDRMQELARVNQLEALILAARPILKQFYPLTPIERYLTWKDENGFLFDSWLRTNLKQGARLIGICPKSTIITDTISGWEDKTNMRFPETGDYIVPGAFAPVKIDYTTNQGSYTEANVWLSYSIN